MTAGPDGLKSNYFIHCCVVSSIIEAKVLIFKVNINESCHINVVEQRHYKKILKWDILVNVLKYIPPQLIT